MPVLGELAVEVLRRWDVGGRTRWTVGSGFVLGDSLILTAAHNVGPGELLVRAGDVERPAVIRLRGDEGLADLALLELTSPLDEAAPCGTGCSVRSTPVRPPSSRTAGPSGSRGSRSGPLSPASKGSRRSPYAPASRSPAGYRPATISGATSCRFR